MNSISPVCPNAEVILAYATYIGVENAGLVYEGLFGWSLHGQGKERRSGGLIPRPLVWKVAEDCGIKGGCGSSNTI